MYVLTAVLVALGACACVGSAQAAEAKPAKGTKQPEFLMKTDQGDITLRLFADKAPISVENFRKYAKSGHYNGTIFHRVIPSFMIQGGGFTADMDQKPTLAQIKNEATNGLSNKRGTIAMARTGVVDSATAQFFINVVDNKMLDNRGTSPSEYGYAVFGEVINGMDVVDKIRRVPTGSKGGHQDVPVKPVVILEVTEL